MYLTHQQRSLDIHFHALQIDMASNSLYPQSAHIHRPRLIWVNPLAIGLLIKQDILRVISHATRAFNADLHLLYVSSWDSKEDCYTKAGVCYAPMRYEWMNDSEWMCECALGHDSAFKGILSRGQPGMMKWILLWNMLLVQVRSLDLLTISPARYHCTTDAPWMNDKFIYG